MSYWAQFHCCPSKRSKAPLSWAQVKTHISWDLSWLLWAEACLQIPEFKSGIHVAFTISLLPSHSHMHFWNPGKKNLIMQLRQYRYKLELCILKAAINTLCRCMNKHSYRAMIAYYVFQGVYFCRKVAIHSPQPLLVFNFSNHFDQIYFCSFSGLSD